MTESVHHVKADTFMLNVLCFPLATTSTVMQSAVGKLSGQGAIPACNVHRFQFISVLYFFNREREAWHNVQTFDVNLAIYSS